MNHSTPGARSRFRCQVAASASALVAALLLAACATAPPSADAAISAASQAITNADQNRIPDAAAPDLAEARTKLEAARLAQSDAHPDIAGRLAREATIDAELAAARSNALRAELVNQQLQSGNTTLQNELQRTRGDAP